MTMIVKGLGLAPAASIRLPSPSVLRMGTPPPLRTGVPQGTANFYARQSGAAVWAQDRAWAPASSIIDGRLCVATDPPVSWTPSCGGGPICNWAFFDVNKACDPTTFQEVMFQGNRYIWAQQQLQQLLNAKPSRRINGDRVNAEQWADWSIKVLRLVSLARWATNIRPDYLTPLDGGLNAGLKHEEIMSFLRATPTKDDPRDQIETNNVYTKLLFRPRSFTPSPAGAVAVPTSAEDFDPVWTANAQRLSLNERPWPWEHFGGASPADSGPGTVGGSRVRDAMVAWFQRTLGSRGDGWWWAGRRVRATVMGRKDCPSSLAPSQGCPRNLVGRSHWWGSADAHIETYEAWAQDIIGTSFGEICTRGLDAFFAKYEALPPEMRTQTDQVVALKAQVQAQFATTLDTISVAISAVGGAAAAIPVVGVVVTVAVAILGIVLQLLRWFGVAAMGGGRLEEMCLPPPLLRMIKAPGPEGGCDFDTRGSEMGRVANQVQLITVAAAAGAPVSLWFEASKNAADPDAPPIAPDDGSAGDDTSTDEGVSPWVIAAGAGVILGGAYLATRPKK